MASYVDWHRLFGILLADLFSDLPFTVELEKDLSQRRQFLDVVIIRREPGAIREELPDGLDNLADHNLITYKSLREPLDADAVEELIGHGVNYRKQESKTDLWLPRTAVALYAVCTRFPQKLAGQIALEPVDAAKPGVYHLQYGTAAIRVIVLSEIRDGDANRLWGVFSGVAEKVRWAARRFRPKRLDGSTILNDLFKFYKMEGLSMPYTIEEYMAEAVPRLLRSLPPQMILKEIPAQELLKEIPTEELLKNIPVEERLKNIPVEERLKDIPVEERLKGLPVADRLKDLSVDEIQAYLAERLRAEAGKESS